MPSLLDALAALDAQSNLVADLATQNRQPAGPFTVAQMQGNVNVLDIIRDAEEHERRLYTRVGEQEGGKGKMAEKRSKGMVTPLRQGLGGHLGVNGKGKGREGEVGQSGEKWSDPQALLMTALTLVDEYRPMPRTRAHILSLLGDHEEKLNAIASLESDIEAAQQPGSSKQANQSTSIFDEEEPPFDDEDGPGLTPDELLKEEEEALKKLEAEVAEMRKQKRAPTVPKSPYKTFGSPSPHKPTPGSRLISTPLRATPGRSAPTPNTAKSSLSPHTATFGRQLAPGVRATPAGAVSPGQLAREKAAFGAGGSGKLARSLAGRRMNGESPASMAGETPRASANGHGAGLQGDSTPEKQITPSGLNGLQDTSSASIEESPSPSLHRSTVQGKKPAALVLGGNRSPGTSARSPRTPTSAPSPLALVTPRSASGEMKLTPTPKAKSVVAGAGVAASASKKGRKLVEGVEVRSALDPIIARIWLNMGDFLRQGENSPETGMTLSTIDTIQHLAKLSSSKPDPPPSPSNASSLSFQSSSLASTVASLPRLPAPPLTDMSIGLSHLLLLLLRSPPEYSCPELEIKEALSKFAEQKGFGSVGGQGKWGVDVLFKGVATKGLTLSRTGAGFRRVVKFEMGDGKK